MLRPLRFAVRAAAGVALLTSATAASAQMFAPGSGCGCSTQAPAISRVSYMPPAVSCPQPVQTHSCRQAVPVVQQCLQQVPVTEYQQVRQKVRRQVTEVEYVDQPATVYRPVTETKYVDVPVQSFQNVTEYQTVTRECGHWQTNFHCNRKVTPCEYDSRPGFLGAMNRTGYSVRSAFTPSVVATRQWVSQPVAQQVPVTRRVATQCMQRQAYQVTNYVAEQTTRRVAVNRVKWVEDEVTALRPVTVVKTVPVTRTAWTWAPVGSTAITLAPTTQISSAPSTATQSALAPSPDPISRTAARPTPAARTATRSTEEDTRAYDDRRETEAIENNQAPVRSREAELPAARPTGLFTPVGARSAGSSIARVSNWRSTTRIASEGVPVQSSGPAIAATR